MYHVLQRHLIWKGDSNFMRRKRIIISNTLSLLPWFRAVSKASNVICICTFFWVALQLKCRKSLCNYNKTKLVWIFMAEHPNSNPIRDFLKPIISCKNSTHFPKIRKLLNFMPNFKKSLNVFFLLNHIQLLVSQY